MIENKMIEAVQEGWFSVGSALIDGYGIISSQSKDKKILTLAKTPFKDEPKPSIGKGTKIWHFSHVMAGAKIGKNCVIGQNCFIGKDVVIGDGCKIQNNVSVYSKVTLGNDVFVGPSAVFTNDLNPRAKYPKKGKWLPTIVKDGVTIGANATILCNITINEYAMIGAGAVVVSDVPKHALMVGVPAKVLWWVCEKGHQMHIDMSYELCAICTICGKRYGLWDELVDFVDERWNTGGKKKCKRSWRTDWEDSMK